MDTKEQNKTVLPIYSSNNEELLKKIKSRIDSIDTKTHIDIFKIFKEHDVPFSENSNGIFINISEVDNTIIEKVDKYLDYLYNQENELNKIEQQKEQYKSDFFTE